MAAWMRSPLALLVGPNRRDLLAACTLTDLRKSKSRLIAENALLRQQLVILKRQVKRPPPTETDRILLILLAKSFF
jgi:hypothetical protein